MQKPTLQTILISILIIVALFTSIYFPYKFKQLSNDFLYQTNQYGELLKQINDLQKEVKELKNVDMEINDLKDWKIYRNEDFGFEIKYPSKFIVKGDEEGVQFFNKKEYELWKADELGYPLGAEIFIEKFTIEDKDIVAWRKKKMSSEMGEETIIDINNIKLHNYNWIIFHYSKEGWGEKFEFYLQKENSIIEVNLLDWGKEPDIIFNQILSSFKFIDQNNEF